MIYQKLYFNGPKESLAPNSEIVVSVLLDSAKPINAFDLKVNYDASKLQFLGSDNTNSIVDIWQTKPSNVQGGVEFSGGILNDFSGNGGHIVKLAFKVLDTDLATDTINVSFGKNDLYLADGKGTKAEVSASSFSLDVREDTAVVYSEITPFKSTPSDIRIEQELQTFKSEMFWENSLTTSLYFVFIIFVICAWRVYNKSKRKL